MKRGELMEYKGRTLFRKKKGVILIYKDGRPRGYAPSVKDAKEVIDEAVRDEEE